MYKRTFAMLASATLASACAPIEKEPSDNYAQVCDDAKEPDCAPDREVIVR